MASLQNGGWEAGPTAEAGILGAQPAAAAALQPRRASRGGLSAALRVQEPLGDNLKRRLEKALKGAPLPSPAAQVPRPLKVNVCEEQSSPLPVWEWSSDKFFLDSNAFYSRHQKLLKDSVCMETFRDVMYQNKHLFKDKVVLDVGCGMGILSMFAARAGAARVIGVDCSAILDYTEKIIRANKLDDVITLVRGKVEEVELPADVLAVDIIVCDWMGYSLFHKSLIGAVIFAKHKWLKPSGLIFPDRASLFICGYDNRVVKEREINWWLNVHGFNMLALQEAAVKEPLIYTLAPRNVVSTFRLIKEVDLYTTTMDDLIFTAPFELTGTGSHYVTGLATFFKVEFSRCHKSRSFWTNPGAPFTHWRQSLFTFGVYDLPFYEKHKLSGTFSVLNVSSDAGKDRRPLEVSIKVDLDNGMQDFHQVLDFTMPK